MHSIYAFMHHALHKYWTPLAKTDVIYVEKNLKLEDQVSQVFEEVRTINYLFQVNNDTLNYWP